MKLTLFLVLFQFAIKASAFSGDGMPFKFISSCEIDLNGDDKADKAILIEGLNGRELIALIASKKGYDAFVVSTGKENMYMSCKFGSEVKESFSGDGTGKVFKTKGTYIHLIKPESSSVAYFWYKGTFKEVWTGD